jgi:hypothetical protein
MIKPVLLLLQLSLVLIVQLLLLALLSLLLLHVLPVLLLYRMQYQYYWYCCYVGCNYYGC